MLKKSLIRCTHLLGVLLTVILTVNSIPVLAANEDCLACHRSMEYGKAKEGTSRIHDASGNFLHEQHSPFPCSACHTDIKEVPHRKDIEHNVKCETCHSLVSGHATTGDSEVTGEYADNPKVCITCHRGEDAATNIYLTTHATTADPASPFAHGNQGCESCHGPSKAHVFGQARPPVSFSKNTPAEEKNSTCLGCHGENRSMFHWAGSVHDTEDTACVDCHTVHTANDPVLALETQPQVCFTCHQEQRAQFLRQSRHPVDTGTGVTSHVGLLSCADCHSPHGSNSPGSLVKGTLNDTCYECHAEKRGPFLWEHQPVREDCAVCHQPHGANYEALLVAREPWLCQRCHAAQRHPSTAFSGADIPPQGAGQSVLAGSCLNCHQQVHGSNHPSGVRITR